MMHVPADARRLVDVAFSGNGEPTSAPDFHAALACVEGALRDLGFLTRLKIRLITNGSLMHRPAVQRAIARIGELNGEVWFKVDAATIGGIERINRVHTSPQKVGAALERCARLAPTWVQTCCFAYDGAAMSAVERSAYLEFIAACAGKIKGVHLYGLARPSMQPDASRLSNLSADAIQNLAESISSLGVEVLAKR